MINFFKCSLIALLLLFSWAPIVSAQEIIETVYLEKDDGLASRKINHVIRDNKGYFYLFGDNNIQQYDGQNFQKVDLKFLEDNNIKPEDILDVIADSNQLYLHTKDKVFTISAGKLFVNNSESPAPKRNGISQSMPSKTTNGNEHLVEIDDKQYLWTSNEIYRVTADKKKLIATLPFDYEDLKFVNFDSAGNTVAVYSSSQQTMHHIYVLDTLENLFDYSLIIEDYSTLKDIYTDDVFHKWMVAGYNGIKIYTFKRKGVNFLAKIPGIEKSQFGRIITRTCIFKDQIIFNSESKSHFIYDTNTKELKELFNDFPFISGQLGNIKCHPENDFCIQLGKDNADLTDIYILDISSEKVEHHTVSYDLIDFEYISPNSLYLVGQDVNTGKGILAEYDLLTKKQKVLLSETPSIRSISYNKNKSQLWLATVQGVYVFDEFMDLLAVFNAQADQSNYLRHDDIVMTCSYADVQVACSRGGGIYIIDATEMEVVKNISENEGLTNNIAVGVIVDDIGNCWISTYNGLNILNKDLEITKKIYDFDGLPNREFNSLAVTKDQQGKLYFGTLNGLCVIDPVEVLKWKNSYKLVVNEIDAGGIELDLDSEIYNIYDSADSLVISYSFTDYVNYPYAVPKVEVSSSKENKIRSFKNKISVSEINRGALELNLSVEQKPLRRLQIEIKKDFRKIINVIVLILGVLFISSLIIWTVISYIKRKEKEKTELNKKMNELKLASLQGQMNPHFIFNALGSIQYFIQTSNIKQADAYLSDFAVLMRGILDSSKKKMISLSEELKLLKIYIGLEKTRFEDKFDVQFFIHDDTDLSINIPPMILQPYIENAINHGLHHLKDRKGKLDISFYPDAKNHLNVEIKDNGIGRAAAAQMRIQKSHKSRGMDNISERVNVINSSKLSNIDISIEDLTQEGHPSGTLVKLIFKE